MASTGSKRAQTSADKILCPKCGELIPITETLHQQLAEEARAEIRREIAEKQKALTDREAELRSREAALQKERDNIDVVVQERLLKERPVLLKDALKKARSEAEAELKLLRDDVAEKEEEVQALKASELTLRREKRELEAKKKAIELEIVRKVDAERDKIREDTAKEISEEYRLKNAEKDRKLQDALKANEELRRKLQQGSQQTQGEVLELELEQLLTEHCPLDEILPVPKGVRGADVLQRVRTKTGLVCGSILWETKHTKNWSDGWIAKLQEDQREAKADLAVLVTTIVPKDLAGFGFREGIWIVTPRLVSGLLIALRRNLTEVAIARISAAAKNDTVEALYKYLTGPEFRHRVEAIVTGFMVLKEDLNEERRIFNKRWSKRDKQLDVIIMNTGGMYGDLQGLIGTPLQPIPALEAGDADTEVLENNKSDHEPPEEVLSDDTPF